MKAKEDIHPAHSTFRATLFSVCLIASVVPCLGQDIQSTFRADAVMATLLRRAATETAQHAGVPAVTLRILPIEVHPMVAQVFSEELARAGTSVRLGEAQDGTLCTVDVREMSISPVSMDNSSYLARSALTLGVLLSDASSGSVRWSKEFQLAELDTVRGTEPRAVDYRDAESPSWIEGVLAPLAAVGAAVVIILLLFTVRGS